VSNFINRDLSLIEFFVRVLEEAQDPGIPLLERLKFIAILASNLDEFFMIRVSGLKERLGLEAGPPIDGISTRELLSHIRTRVSGLVDEQMRCLRFDLLPALSAAGISIKSIDSLTNDERCKADKYFRERIYPLLTPQAVDPTHPFPYISGGSINLGLRAKPAFRHKRLRGFARVAEEFFVRVKIPSSVPRFISFGSATTFVLVEDLISVNITDLVPDAVQGSCFAFRITRDADIEVREAETADLLEAMEENLKLRRFGDVVRLAVDKNMPHEMTEYLSDSLAILPEDIYAIDGPLDASAFFEISDIDRPDLKDRPISHAVPKQLAAAGSIFDAIAQNDILLHHPYMPYSLITDFIREAVDDPDVLAIKMCLYRMGAESPIAPLLIKASEQGKQVTVLIEIKARFDEANNIEWAKRLERAGVHVIYGLVGLKTHCKTTLIVRRELGKLVRYIHVATGNYNPDTSAFYTDLSLLTANNLVGEDATELFNYLTVYSQRTGFRELVVAPIYLRQKMIELIRREIGHIRQGGTGRIIAKMNRLADAELVNTLYEASQAGVEIDLIVRGICTLRPGVPGLSDNIRVRSVVGRLLEHSRVYFFGNGGQPEVFTGSSDWMPRNLDRRVEVLVPVHDPRIRNYLCGEFLAAYLKDNVKARVLRSDGIYERVARNSGELDFDSQLSFQEMANIVQFEKAQ